jgi:hypothetical protein
MIGSQDWECLELAFAYNDGLPMGIPLISIVNDDWITG